MKSLQYYTISLGNLLRGAKDVKRKRPFASHVYVTELVVDVKIPTAIDTSHYDPPTDWSLIPKTVVFMGTKATEGAYYKDPTFPEIFSKTKSILNIHRLAYHFFRKAYDPIKQADWFINYIEPYLDDTDILCLDFEEGGETARQLWAFLNRVIQRRPRNQLMIYSRKDLMNAVIMTASEKAFFKSIPSWVAGYPYDPNIYTTTPEGYKPDSTKWGAVWMWQYSDAGQVAGFDGAALDVNLIEKPLLDYIGGTGETPPPVEVKMQGFKCVKIVNMRDSAGIVIGQLQVGDKVWGVQSLISGLQRVTFDNVYRVSGVKQAWPKTNSAISDGTYTFLTAITEQEPGTVTPPPASGDIVANITLKADGTVTGTWTES